MTRTVFLMCISVFIAAVSFCAGNPLVVALQPLGAVNNAVIERVVKGISTAYNVKIIVLPRVELPISAYYKPNKRYRADKILVFLITDNYREYDKVVGLTDKDISTTKGAIYDWGIFGLGSVGGRPCVISTFRLCRGASQEKFLQRLVKVANHELGHTLGLQHCPTAGCLMEDAKGTIVTVDNESGALCGRCKKGLQKYLHLQNK